MTGQDKSISTRLRRGAGVALWRQIADEIRGGLAEGLAGQGGKLPAESELAARFKVNRHTVRAAIAALANEGVLRSEQGRGTFVKRQKRLSYPIGARTRFSAGLGGQAGQLKSRLIEAHNENVEGDVARALGLRPGSLTIRIEALGSADDVPVSRVTTWFDAMRFPSIAAFYRQSESITQALAAHGVKDYTRAWTRVEARHADPQETLDLKLSAGAVVIVATSLNVDRGGSPIQFSVSRFPADRVQVTIGENDSSNVP